MTRSTNKRGDFTIQIHVVGSLCVSMHMRKWHNGQIDAGINFNAGKK